MPDLPWLSLSDPNVISYCVSMGLGCHALLVSLHGLDVLSDPC